nr:MAG TPA: restriction alleviation protein [Caudoviricetes sp.]
MCLEARATDCKSVTSETPQVRLLPCPFKSNQLDL